MPDQVCRNCEHSVYGEHKFACARTEIPIPVNPDGTCEKFERYPGGDFEANHQGAIE